MKVVASGGGGALEHLSEVQVDVLCFLAAAPRLCSQEEKQNKTFVSNSTHKV
jgi:hypothetical protein